MTPGTVSDEALLPERQDNLIVAVYQEKEKFGLATLDMTSGRFQLCEPHSKEALQAELQRINPVELLYCEDFAEMSIIEPYKGLRQFGNLNSVARSQNLIVNLVRKIYVHLV